MAKAELGKKNVGQFVLYMVIIALCIVALLWMLINSKPTVAPKIKNGGAQSLLLPAVAPSSTRVVSA